MGIEIGIKQLPSDFGRQARGFSSGLTREARDAGSAAGTGLVYIEQV